MIQWLAGLQPAVVGGVLLWAGTVKLFGRSAPLAARRSALVRLVGPERVLGAYRLVGCVEVAVAVMLVLPPAHPAEAGAALGLGVGMLGYLAYARLVAPRSSCGCLGEKHAPVRWRSFARVGVLIAAGGLAMTAVDWWAFPAVERPFATVGVLLAEAALVVVLSSELDGAWLFPLRRFRIRLRHPLAGQPFEVPVESTVQQLHKSQAYRSVADLLRSDLLDTWDEGEWRILTYSARQDVGGSTAVFAVPKQRYEPDLVRVVLVSDESVVEGPAVTARWPARRAPRREC